ncbi:MAG: hypothetical protein RIS29_1099 [Bacteroidota bacterium]|jgi:type I restriction enzyme S subunit
MRELNKIPKHWQVKKLGEVLKVSSGKGLKINLLQGGNFPVYGGNGINGYHSEYLIEEPRLIIGRVGAKCGVTHITKPKSWVTDNALIVEPIIADFNIKFFQLKLEYENLNKLSVSTAQPVISGSKIYDYEIVLPPLPEQLAIVSKIEELLSDLENGKQQLLTAQQQLKVYRQSLLKAAFEGRLTNKEVKEGELPNGWKWVKIDDIADSLDNMRKPVNKDQRKKMIGEIPYYGANGRVDWVNDFIFNEPLVCVVEDETFIGRTIPFSYKIIGKSWVNNHAHVLRAKSNTEIDFLNYQLSYYPFLPLTTGTTGRKKLTKAALMNAPFVSCSLSEQHQIVEILESKLTVCDKIEETIAQSLQQAEVLKQSILKKAFEGRLV